MGKPSKSVMDFMAKYKVDSNEVWEVHGSTWVVKHKALERVAAEVGIVFDRPSVITCDLANKIACICVFGKLGERSEWSFGEASPANNKNAYTMAMSEKRAKDRVILKLLVTHGALYSESEADEFNEPRQNPHVTRSDDILPNTDGDPNNIPPASEVIKPLPKAKSNDLFAALQNEIWRCGTHDEMKYWGSMNTNRIGTMHPDYQKMLRGVYKEHWDQIAALEDGDEKRIAS